MLTRESDQPSELPDSVEIKKRLHGFYSRFNPAKAEQVRRSRAKTRKSEEVILGW